MLGWYFLQRLAGAILWVLANAVYISLKRKGIRGFGRFAAFWAGLPGTFISMLVITEGQVERLDKPLDDDDRLLREIRIDRELRGLERPSKTEGDGGETMHGGMGSPPG